MKRFKGILYAATMLLALMFSCSSPTDTPTDFTVTITGAVLRQNAVALDSVVTVLDNPYRRDTVKSDGLLTISFTSAAKSAVTANLTFQRPRFYDTTIAVTYGPSAKNVALNIVKMKAISSTDDSVVVRASKRPGVIVHLGTSVKDLSIRDAGGTDVATITFEVRDSSGVPVDAGNKALVGFRLVTKPDASTYLSIDTASTNSVGTVSVQLTAGTTAGIAQVMAVAAVKKSDIPLVYDTLRSPVVSIPIHGGAPDSAHFSIASEKYNVAGGVKYNIQTIISALVGDKFGNAVQPGTVVSFRSNGGVIQSYGTTSDDGGVSVILRTGEPVPAGGLVTITAEIGGSGLSAIRKAKVAEKESDDATVVETATRKGIPKPLASYVAKSSLKSELSNAPGTFKRTLQILFSGATQIHVVDTNFVVPVGSSKQVNFTVSDADGNPLSGGSTVSVSAAGQGAGDVELSGDIQKTIPDTKSPAYTAFRVFLRDKRTTGTDQTKPVDLRIEVASDNGNLTMPVAGRLLNAAGSDSGRIGSISLVNSNPDSITVNGAGISSTSIQFKVLDVFGKPAANIPLGFEFVKSVNGGEYLTPISATTDVNGLASTTLVGGIRSGTVQVGARVKIDSVSITSPAKSVYIRTGFVSSIALVSSSSSHVSVQGSGGAESATLVFEARDTLGNAIDLANQTQIRFLLRGDTAATKISPNPVATDPATGRIVVNFTSGTKSGIVQIYATARNGIVKSSPVSMTIYGGAPDSSHFSLVSEKYNLAGGVKFGLKTKITVLLGDTYGNPVQPGTGVYFSTTGGIIQSTGTTSEDGSVSVDLTTSDPVPPSGFAIVSARIGSGGKADASALPKVLANFRRQKTQILEADARLAAPMTYSKSIPVLFSGHTQIAIADTNFLVPVGGTKQVNYRVADPNGNPLSPGTAIKVTATGQAAGDVELSGDIDKTLLDTWDPAFTTFHVLVRDKRTTGATQVAPVELRVDVTSDNDNATRSASGRLLSQASGSDSGKVGKIELVKNDPDTVTVTGGGGTTSTQIQFKVSDVFDKPSPNIPVSFDIIKSVGGGEYMTPISATTDASGLVSATLKSGIRSGIVQLVASVRKDSVSIVSPAKTVYISTGQIAQIAFISVSTSEVSVQGVGGTEFSTIVFEARDSLGNAIDFTHQSPIRLVVRGDTTGTHINPNPAMTDPVTGRIIANFSPGVRAGVVQVYATALSGTVTSAPVPITIHGGFADQAHFSIISAPKNISYKGGSANFSVLIGDKWSNPVNDVMVYFSASGGVITASSHTAGGIASATWINANPFPTNGFLWLRARTVGENGQFVQDSVNVMYSGPPQVTFSSSSVVNDSLKLLDGSFVDINYVVADLLGHPLSEGNTVTVSVSGPAAGELDLTGITSFIVPETIDTVGGTHFSFRVGDKLVGSGKTNPFTIKVTVDGISGHLEKMIYGILYAPGDIFVPPSARKPAQIGFLGSTATDIYISGVGALENAMITYEVRDSLGVPITRTERTYATFSLQFYPNTFGGTGGTSPTLLPSADSTDDLGKLRVSILSGTAAGVVKVTARIQTASGIIISEPVNISVHAGFPDQRHFTIAPVQYNFPGLQRAYLAQNITVLVGDQFSNPVKDGTAVYFNASHGVIQTGPISTKDGFVTNTFYSGNPLPLGADTLQVPYSSTLHGEGFGRIFARTLGKTNAQIIDSIPILWTGSPILVNTSASTDYNGMTNGATSGPYTFTVTDYLGHPMSPGTTISVSGDALVMSGDGVGITMPDVMIGGPGFTSFSVMAEDADATTVSVPPKKSQITLRVVHPVYGTYTRVLATGTVQ